MPLKYIIRKKCNYRVSIYFPMQKQNNSCPCLYHKNIMTKEDKTWLESTLSHLKGLRHVFVYTSSSSSWRAMILF